MTARPLERHLTEAVGYLELGILQDAWDSLEEIPAEQRHLPPVLQVRLEIYRRMEKYEGMATIAEHLTKALPEDSQNWISLAYAQRRYLDLQTAEKTLLEAQKRFPEEATIPFNLACYACQMGRLDEAREKLAKAIEMEPSFKKAGIEDEILKAIW
jgi:tetratricopeptide (TPR) repeat protein